MTGSPPAAAQRAYYSATLAEFQAAKLDEIFGRMARRNDFDLIATQRDAWLEQGVLLQRVLARYDGAIYLEFTIPRMGRRIDAVVVIGAVSFVLEFKVGERRVPCSGPGVLGGERDRGWRRRGRGRLQARAPPGRSADTYRASAVLAKGAGFCVGKAALLAAVARAEGIPARLRFADVRNHLCTPPAARSGRR